MDRDRVTDFSDHWLWIVDDQFVHAPLGADALDKEDKKRGIELPALARAVVLNAEGKTVNALKEIDFAVESGQTEPELHWAKGQLEFELGRYQESLKAYEEVLKSRPKQKAAIFNIGLCLEKQGLFVEAADRYRQVTKIDPPLLSAHLGLGGCLLHLDEPEAALVEFNFCLESNPEHDRALMGKAAALHILQRFDEAFELYSKVLRSYPTDPDLLGNLVGLCAARQDEHELRIYAEKLLKINPGARAALEGLVTAALMRSNYDVASYYGAQYVKAVPDLYEGWFNLGFAFQKTGQTQDAANAYQEAIKIRLDGYEALGNLAMILQENDDLERARQAYERVLALSPEHTGILWNLALLHHHAGNLEEAEKCYAALTGLKPDWDDAWLRLGYIRLQLNNYQGAIDALQNIATKPKARADAQVNLGIAYWRAGKPSEAREMLEKALQERPDAGEFLAILAAVVTEQGDTDQAAALEARLAKTGDRLPELSYNVGVLLQKAGRNQEAASAFERAVEQKPGFGEALLNLGHAWKALGEEDKAKQCWKEAVEANPDLAPSYYASH